MRLVAVVLGSENDKRFNDVSALMDYGFRYFVTEKLFSESEPLKDLRVVAGVSDFVSIGLKEDIILTLQKNKRDNLSFEVSAGSQILAPINAFDKAGTLKVIDDENNVIVETDLVYLDSVEELGFFQRLIAILWNWIKSLFS